MDFSYISFDIQWFRMDISKFTQFWNENLQKYPYHSHKIPTSNFIAIYFSIKNFMFLNTFKNLYDDIKVNCTWKTKRVALKQIQFERYMKF